ncbi:MAG: DUF3152 domain-containing protein [Kineosporiaceae bacterium]
MARHGSGPAPRVNRPAVGLLATAVVLGLGAGGWALVRPAAAGTTAQVTGAGGTSPAPSVVTTSPSPSRSDVAASSDPSTATASPAAGRRTTRSAPPAGLTAADVAAGLLSASVPQRGAGALEVVPGSAEGPGSGRVVRVRVEVEGGLKVDGEAFADFALATLNDPRSWAHDGRTFARTDGRADVRLVLASPDTSARLCRPLQTFGRLSCHAGDATVLTLYRWVEAIPAYGKDKTGYRHYLVNHEVGHALGHGHVACPGRGRPAPVMMQQTKGLTGCAPNAWPYP